MAKKIKAININNDSMFIQIKTFIPESIVMNAEAYRNEKSKLNTISNVLQKVKNDFMRTNPNLTVNWNDYDTYLIEIIQMRILIK